MSTFQYLWSSCSVQPLVVPTAKMVFLVIKSTTVCGSWISSQPLSVCTTIGWKQCCMVLSFLKTYRDIFWGASLLWRLPDPIIHSFQRLISCQLTTFSNETLIAWVRPFPSQLQLRHRSDIESDWCCGTSPACETKPTVCKLSKSRCSPI